MGMDLKNGFDEAAWACRIADLGLGLPIRAWVCRSRLGLADLDLGLDLLDDLNLGVGLCRSRHGGGVVGVIKGRDKEREKKNAMRKEKKNSNNIMNYYFNKNRECVGVDFKK